MNANKTLLIGILGTTPQNTQNHKGIALAQGWKPAAVKRELQELVMMGLAYETRAGTFGLTTRGLEALKAQKETR